MRNLQVVQPRQPAAPAARPPLRVFLSYSHDDAEHADAFVTYFKPLLKLLGVELFYDSERLKPGYQWEATLLHELRRSQVFVFLVSAHSLDGYCMDTELAQAVAARLRIVPVLLSECLWEDCPIPLAPAGETLAKWKVLPIRNRKLLPVKDWGKREHAWTTVIKALRPLLEEAQAAAPAPPPPWATRGAAPELGLLPYLCGQDPIVGTFDRELRTLGDCALVVLVRGEYWDNPERFWERLRVEYLSSYVASKSARGPNLAPDRPLLLPVEGQGSPAQVRTAILGEFSRMLTENHLAIEDVPSLTRHLGEHARAVGGTIAILAVPNARSLATLCNALESLLALLDEITDPAVLRRIVVAVHLERADLPEPLVPAWNLQRFARARVTELGPLGPVDRLDADNWYRYRRVREQLGIADEPVKGLFSRNRKHRLRRFAHLLQGILQSSPTE